jgi:hypothetical protein
MSPLVYTKPAAVATHPDAAARPSYVIDVSRPEIPLRWTSVVMAPVELLALAWSVPVAILMITAPIGLGLAGVLWVARAALR